MIGAALKLSRQGAGSLEYGRPSTNLNPLKASCSLCGVIKGAGRPVYPPLLGCVDILFFTSYDVSRVCVAILYDSLWSALLARTYSGQTATRRTVAVRIARRERACHV